MTDVGIAPVLAPILGRIGSNQLIPALDELVPKLERRPDRIVVMITSLIPFAVAQEVTTLWQSAGWRFALISVKNESFLVAVTPHRI